MISNISYRCWHVWRRNLDVGRVTWLTNIAPPLAEPLLYILAFGFGVGAYVKNITYEGRPYDYLTFIAPGMIASGVMFHAMMECMYGSFIRMRYQKTFSAILCTPLLIEDILAGELLWGTTKGLFAGAAVLLICSCFKLVTYPTGLLVLPLAALSGLMLAGFGLFFAGISPYIDTLNVPVFLFVNPMFLFSGTFFPLDALPRWAQGLAWFLPLTPVSALMRAATLNSLRPGLWWGVVYLLVVGPAISWLGMAKMRARLVK
jgi:lipooligosaccharide transport system permease protein